MRYKITVLLIIFIGLAMACSSDSTIEPEPGITGENDINIMGVGKIEFPSNAVNKNKPLNLWYFSPEDNPKDATILFVMHGTNRDADSYRDSWVQIAKENNLLLIVPEFSDEDFPGSRSYNLGNIFNENGLEVSEETWSFSLIEPIFDYVVNEIKGNQTDYNLYGHSAGSQFVTRFLTFKEKNRVKNAVAANAGWYTLLDLNKGYPYGLKNSPATNQNIKTILNKKVTILLGEEDTDTNDSNLRKTPEAQEQGVNRFERGQYYFNESEQLAENNSYPFRWELKTVPGVGHSNAKMANSAIKYILD